eukprot:scaffold185313_cov36-Tisochrysis_lutea.AAC.3
MVQTEEEEYYKGNLKSSASAPLGPRFTPTGLLRHGMRRPRVCHWPPAQLLSVALPARRHDDEVFVTGGGH